MFQCVSWQDWLADFRETQADVLPIDAFIHNDTTKIVILLFLYLESEL